MKSAHILVAEDDRNIREGLVDTLESEGYQVTAAVDGDSSLDLLAAHDYDLVILDIMMPGTSGYDVCREIRSRNQSTPIIMLTAKGEEIDKVIGLQLGADDYVTKPFGVRELLARIAAVLRRSRQTANHQNMVICGPDIFSFGNVEIDARQYKAKRAERTMDLSAKELRLLQCFHAHPNEVLSRDLLLQEVWGMDYFGTTRTLDQHVAKLRKKIEPDPRNPKVIITVHGVGYRYEPNQSNG
jgi:two-component system, OmpR family, alkaline phosphatase synthesis response regulator PhoP